MNFSFARQRREKIARRKRGAGKRREGRRTLWANFETMLRGRCGTAALIVHGVSAVVVTGSCGDVLVFSLARPAELLSSGRRLD